MEQVRAIVNGMLGRVDRLLSDTIDRFFMVSV